MAMIHIIEGFKPMNDQRLIDKANNLKPQLLHKNNIVKHSFAYRTKQRIDYKEEELRKGDTIILDFGTHLVGYLTLDLGYKGSHPDAPVYLKFNFCERLDEIYEDTSKYNGWISSSWIQEEYIHIDMVPYLLQLPRRYAFRYVKITVLDTSPKYALKIHNATVDSVSAVDMEQLEAIQYQNDLYQKLDEVSLRTLQNCMQDVFEDGPKRDQRLWMGDLRLQALTNYASFKNYDLVKRCLYLFAGSRFPDGRVAACVFTNPEVEADDTYLYEYSMLFTVALEEYLQETGDKEAFNDLYDIALEQIDIALSKFDHYLPTSFIVDHTFVDWSEGVDKEACCMAEMIYCLRYAILLCERKQDQKKINEYTSILEKLLDQAYKTYYDPVKKVIVSNGQVSIMSQVWMTLAEVISKQEAKDILSNTPYINDYKMNTPYMHHYYVTALLECGLKDQAIVHLKEYWGKMVELGADTFYEAFDPSDINASPYGGSSINSYCHAWSCTPAYLIRKKL